MFRSTFICRVVPRDCTTSHSEPSTVWTVSPPVLLSGLQRYRLFKATGSLLCPRIFLLCPRIFQSPIDKSINTGSGSQVDAGIEIGGDSYSGSSEDLWIDEGSQDPSFYSKVTIGDLLLSPQPISP